MDEALGNLTSAIRAAGMWDNTLMVLFGDNGGAVPDGGRNWLVKPPITPLLGPLVIAVSFWFVFLLYSDADSRAMLMVSAFSKGRCEAASGPTGRGVLGKLQCGPAAGFRQLQQATAAAR